MHLDASRPRPDFARLIDLADEAVARVRIGIHDQDQRMLLVGEARDLIERIQATLEDIPTWPRWAVVEPPLGRLRRR